MSSFGGEKSPKDCLDDHIQAKPVKLVNKACAYQFARGPNKGKYCGRLAQSDGYCRFCHRYICMSERLDPLTKACR